MTNKAPGRSEREGLTLIQLMDMSPDETAATKWFEAQVWPTGRCCGNCGATNTTEVPNAKPMPYGCPDFRSYFSVRTDTALCHSRVPLRKWAIAIYLGHASVNTTMRYARADVDLKRAARSQVFPEALAPPKGRLTIDRADITGWLRALWRLNGYVESNRSVSRKNAPDYVPSSSCSVVPVDCAVGSVRRAPNRSEWAARRHVSGPNPVPAAVWNLEHEVRT